MRLQIAAGFDGSDSDDWTALRCETRDGWQFTPRYGPDRRPTIWEPDPVTGKIPRLEVHAAVDEIFTTHAVARFYYDTRDWKTEGETWALKYGEERVLAWDTFRVSAMHAALVRYKVDLSTGALTHDGCPITTAHMGNARKYARPGERYIIGKPAGAYHQKIDASVASVICHEAACDARVAGWPDDDEYLDYGAAGV